MFKVPLIPSGLTQEETITQIANVFEYLDGIVNHVFDKITTRIEANNARVSAIQTRIRTADQQVEALKSTKKSIQIYSPGKYPGRKSEGVPATITGSDDGPQLDRDFVISCRATPMGESCIKEKLQFFHVRSKNLMSDKLENNRVSLGSNIPDCVSSVADLYVHNTSVFAYQQRQRIRKLEMPERLDFERSPSKLEGKKLEEAPHSILHPDWTNRHSEENFFYTPKINDAPDLEMPEDLPDLPGIAIDIGFGKSKNQQPQKSPSTSAASAAVAEVTVVTPSEEVVPKEVHREETNSLPKLPSFTAAPEPIKSPAVTSATAPPPPPPPPPPPAPPLPLLVPPTTTTVLGETPSPTVAVTKEVSSDARSNLMEAIRKAGGKAKLRAAEPQPRTSSVASSVERKQSENKPASSASPGNLMDDLHKKLMMRRKGISGTKNPANVMDRLSALIPPPSSDIKRADDGDEDDWK